VPNNPNAKQPIKNDRSVFDSPSKEPENVEFKNIVSVPITVCNVWVYTSAFAKRFGMPQEWINDDLKGAEALAYRLDLDVYGIKCGYFSDVENCRPSTACVVDMYIDVPNNPNAKQPIKNDRSVFDSPSKEPENVEFKNIVSVPITVCVITVWLG
jgi:hypothetical protein